MLKILLLGKTGQLGWELNRTLAPTGDLLSLDYPQVDFTNISALQKKVIEWRPQIIINAAAYTDVDKAESEVELAHTINANAPGALAETAQKLGAAFVHYSTDYVFDGTKMEAYVETDITNPLGIYGKSKLAGEQAVEQVGGAYLILRTSWLYSLRCESFVTKVLRWSRQNQKLQIVTDQVGNPTWARMLNLVTYARRNFRPVAGESRRRCIYLDQGQTGSISPGWRWSYQSACLGQSNFAVRSKPRGTDH